MIYYMPFTYLPEDHIRQLTRQLGPMAVQLPMDSLTTGPMQTAAKAGLLQFHPTQGVDPARLHQAVKGFTSWADLHRGKVGDLAGFFRTEQWQEALRKEPGTIQLRTLIRNWNDTSNSEMPVDSNFEAALFLALAHTYDQQQDDLDQEMDAVQTLEKRFEQILGKDDDEPHHLGSSLTVQKRDPSLDRGAYMTRQRIQSWARVARADVTNDAVFIITSRAVWDDLMDMVPEMVIMDCPGAASKPPADDQPDMAIRLADLLKSLSSAKDPRSVVDCTLNSESGQADGPPLKLAVLTGCEPKCFLTHLIHSEQDTELSLVLKEDSSNSIVVGYGLF